MAFGEEEAKAMGVDTERVRLIIILSSTLLTASSVALCGVIGWVGLVVPHIARFLVGANYLSLLPCSMLLGGLFMLIVDNVARSLTAGEIPLGVLTSIIGAPIFLYLLFKGKGGGPHKAGNAEYYLRVWKKSHCQRPFCIGGIR
ncbi:MAG: iron ABC transporter permease [Muricomes sp.]